MIKNLLIVKLILVLVLQPVAVVFAGSGSLEVQVSNINFSSTDMDCEHMNSLDCPGVDICLNVGHAGCEVEGFRILSIVETTSLGLSHSIQAYRKAHFPLTQTVPPLRPPRIS
jgi:hypothetical protein